MEYSINSPPSKKSASIDDYLNDLTDIIKDHKKQKALMIMHEEQMDKVVKILKEDGLRESDPVYAQALILCKNTLDHRNFLSMEIKEGRLNFLKICWEDRTSRTK